MSNAEPLTPPTPQSESSAAVPGASGRLICLDIFRGLAVAGMILVDNPGSDEKVYWPIAHAEWNGWTPADFIFPSFLFLVGVSLVFSFAKRREKGDSRGQILLHVFIRSLLLIVIGLLVNASPFIGVDFHALRFEGVTQRIALCYFAAAILELWSDHRGQIIAIVVCLFGYWALLRFVPVPGLPASLAATFRSWIRIKIWRRGWIASYSWGISSTARVTRRGFSTIPAVATTLLGVLTGHWLRSGRTAAMKAIVMLLAGICGLVAGEVWNIWFPINKNLWTSSFVLFSGGFALVFLAVLYWMLEIKRWRGAWTIPILVFGMNAIAGFVADLLVYGPGYTFTVKHADGTTLSWHDAAQTKLVSLERSAERLVDLFFGRGIFCWILLWLLWRKRIFLKV